MAFGKDRQTVSALAPPAGKTSFVFFDDALKGFGVRVLQSAGGQILKRYCIVYRINGKQRWLMIGDAAKLTEAQARKSAKEKLASVLLGVDPQGGRQAARESASETFKTTVQKYIETEKGTWGAATLGHKNLYLVRGDYFKRLHSMPVGSITRKDVAPLIRAIRTNHSDTTAAHARRHLSAFFSWALSEGFADQDVNPVIDTKNPEGNGPRQRKLEPHELKAIWNACEDADEYGKVVRLLMLTGCRKQEIGKLRWSWFAPDRTSFMIPTTKNGSPHKVPVTPLMRSVIDTIPEMVGRDPLFGIRGEGFTQWDSKYNLLNDGCEHWQLRDLRRTMRSGLGKLKVQPHISELCINHKKQGLIAVYDVERYEDEIADAFAQWSTHVAGIISDGKVVPLRTA